MSVGAARSRLVSGTAPMCQEVAQWRNWPECGGRVTGNLLEQDHVAAECLGLVARDRQRDRAGFAERH